MLKKTIKEICNLSGNKEVARHTTQHQGGIFGTSLNTTYADAVTNARYFSYITTSNTATWTTL